MNRNETITGEWRSSGGGPVSRGDDDADVGEDHVSDLHKQLILHHQVYFDNPTSAPTFDLGEDDQVIGRAGDVPILAAKLNELRKNHDVCTLMSGDTFHGSAVTIYTNEWAMLDPINELVLGSNNRAA